MFAMCWLMFFTLAQLGVAAPGPATRLRVEYMQEPMGVDIAKPRFSWSLLHTDRGQQQSAYEISVYAGEHAIWTTGKVSANTTQNVGYAGPALTPDTSFSWTVDWWDANGEQAPAAQSTFSTGLFIEKDWQGASWIGGSTGVQLRKEFTIKGPIERATAYIIGLGYYKLALDGERVSTHELGPFTTYAERVYYDTHDVTKQLATDSRSHAIGVTLGDGWYAQKSVNVGRPSLYFLLSIELKDGSKQYITSGSDWTSTQGPVVRVDMYDGETFDARLQTPGWDMPGFDDQHWTKAAGVSAPSDHVRITSHAVLPPIRATQTFSACDLWESSPGVFVFDFCQNMAGFTTLRIPAGIDMAANTSIQQLHAEAVHGPKPAAVFHHYGNTKEIGTYITRGDGAAVEYTAQFVYYGFRYVQLTGYPGTPTRETLTAHFIHTDYDFVGSIAFSDPMLTAVQRITRTAAMSNFQSIPTDCPQRERRGWLGDAQLSAETNIFNFDMAGPYTSFVQQIQDSQEAGGKVQDCVPFYNHGQEDSDPAWGGAYVLLADWVGEYYADNEIFGRHYDGITAYVDHLTSLAAAADMDGLLAYGGWSDWCPPQGCRACWNPQASGQPENSVLVSSFYYLTELRVLTRYASFLGKDADAKRYGELAAKVGKAFVAHFYDSEKKTFVEKNRTCGEQLSPQTLISLGVTLGLVPEEDKAAVAKNLIDDIAANNWHLNVGIVGVKYLLPTLSELGRTDVALMIAQQRTPPSYIYMVEQGATTLWETWTGSTYSPVASWNHIMFGSNSEWYYKYLAGLNLAKGTRGWQHIEYFPRVWTLDTKESICANLSSVQASVATPRGLASAAWTCEQDLPTCGIAGEHEQLHLSCPSGIISSVEFASFGTPTGSCATNLAKGSCDSNSTEKIIARECLGKAHCSIMANDKTFGDPCFGTTKALAARIACSGKPAKSFTFKYEVVVPVGSKGSVVLPALEGADVTVIEGVAPVWKSGRYVAGVAGITSATKSSQGVRVEIGSGSFKFTASSTASSDVFVL